MRSNSWIVGRVFVLAVGAMLAGSWNTIVSDVGINGQDIRDDEEMLMQDAQNVRSSNP
jgi:hypothetical protein